MNARQRKNNPSLWFYSEESKPSVEDQNEFLKFNDDSEYNVSEEIFEPFNINRDDIFGEWQLYDPSTSTTQDDFDIQISDLDNDNSKIFFSSNLEDLICDENDPSYGFTDDEKYTKSEILAFEKECMQNKCIDQNRKNKSKTVYAPSVAIKKDNETNGKDHQDEISSSEERNSQSSSSSSTDNCNFAIWTLKRFLPETNKDLDDKGSVLHATADYIESLRAEITLNLRQLGMMETIFWNELDSIFYMQDQTRNKTSTDVQESKEVKRPPNAFIRFSVAFRKLVANDFPNKSNREISQMLGTIWRKMSKKEKQPFVTEFYAELQRTRRDHPEWNYAGKNSRRFEVDLNDIQPERLRPRHPVQNLNYHIIQNTSSKLQVQPKGKKRKVEVENWVQCDLCNKWRKLPVSSIKNLPEIWTCSINPDPKLNTCEKDEEQ